MRLGTISNIKIKEICEKLKIPLQGVLMKDQFNKSSSNGVYIMNLNNSNQSGSHWTVLIRMTKNNYYYMDSFGVVPPQTTLDDLKINPDKLYYNDQQIQHTKASNCGYYCIYFAYCWVNNKKPVDAVKAFLSNFTEDEKENDKTLKTIFEKLL
jgi:hypothetical protein